MKYMMSAFLLLLITSLSLVAATTSDDSSEKQPVYSEDDHSIRVMTFNLRLDTSSDGSNAWPNRKEMVARTMRFHEADFVGIQEGLPHQLDELDEMLPYFKRIGVGRNGTEEDEGEYSAIFYRESRFKLVNDNTFWLSETPNEAGSKGWDAALPRIVTWGEFKDTETDETFFVFNTHFDHIGETARAESAKLILHQILDIAEGKPVVLTGDFNTTENDPPYRILTKTNGNELPLEDAFYHSEYGHHGPTSTWNGFDKIVPDRRIDFIFTNTGFRVLQHAIIADHQDGRFPSDHLPVVAEIEFSE
ncbi:endonuclease/exonuclease/phosphatase family protein [Rhodohalobacter sp. 614A]|uniref:endonuclease/exonuclease/phosphatase family protein n=1 Tax=Rhodohalobacter sp. 614A TaxID=2908649 RepID=UPI001F2B9587|nr:endonuclease/exonuclease/phosphatase family protein [Rhodohalobacter sp. 614A]